MGHVRVKLKIANPTKRQEAVEVEDVLVDTGATLWLIPRALADRLELEVLGQIPAETAAGEVSVDHSYAFIEYDGKQSVSDVAISDSYAGVLVGVYTLEALRLAVDPTSGRLVDTKLLLL